MHFPRWGGNTQTLMMPTEQTTYIPTEVDEIEKVSIEDLTKWRVPQWNEGTTRGEMLKNVF